MFLLAGCHAPNALPATVRLADYQASGGSETLAPGVVHRIIAVGDGTGVELVDIDRSVSAARVVIAVDPPAGYPGIAGPVSPAYTPHDWLVRTGALAAVNGGYFGDETEDGRKEIVGLLVTQGRVRRAAPWLSGQGGQGLAAAHFTRSAFGIVGRSQPSIAWVVTGPVGSSALRSLSSPIRSASLSRVWTARTAIGCGPMLIWDGQSVVTDRAERLASPGADSRTFVAYDSGAPQLRHFVVGIASEMSFTDLAAFLQNYFRSNDHVAPGAAMCLDGGESTQFTYRMGDSVIATRDTGVTVPDAVVVLPR